MIRPRLVAITSTGIAPLGVLEARLEKLLARATPGSVAIQLREHELSARVRLELGRRLASIAERYGAALVVNDRIDLALALGAAGVHLGERSVATEDARRLVPDAWLCRAWHDPERAVEPGVDAVALSPVLAARKGRPALGLGALSRARARLGAETMLFALGGVDAESARDCLDAGADGVAVQSAVLDGREPDPLLVALGIRRS